jgi:WD40 repeat protein
LLAALCLVVGAGSLLGIHRWHDATPAATISPQTPAPLNGAPRPAEGCSTINSLAFSPDGRWLAAATSAGEVALWDRKAAYRRRLLGGHAAPVDVVTFSPDSTTLASGSSLMTEHWSAVDVWLWNPETARLRDTLLAPMQRAVVVRDLAFSPDCNWLAAGGWFQGGDERPVIVWDAARRQEGTHLGRPGHAVTRLAFDPESRRLALVGDRVEIWDHQTGRPVALMEGERWYSEPFQLDNQWVPGRDLRLLTVPGNHSPLNLGGPAGWIDCAALSPDGQQVVTGGSHLRILQVGTGRLINTLKNVGFSRRAVAFSPDGRLIAAGSIDDKVRLWDTRTGGRAATLRAHDFEGAIPDWE